MKKGKLKPRDQMHVHHWRPYGPNMDGKKMWVMCTNRTRWQCPDCSHIPCLCTMTYSLEAWEEMSHEL